MGRRKSKYTPEEAEGRIPIIAKRVALEAVDLVIALEKYPVNSHEVERRIWAMTGQAGFLMSLCHVVWKAAGLRRLAAEGADRG